jgi:hypothetical protein
VERREALRPTSLGARGALPREVGTLIPPPRMPRKHPGASRRSTPSRGSRGIGKPRTQRAARMWKLGCLKCESRIFEVRDRATFEAVIARLDRATQYSGPPESHTSGGDYWFPAFAGMTNLCAGTTPILKPQHLRSRRCSNRTNQHRGKRVPGRHEQR